MKEKSKNTIKDRLLIVLITLLVIVVICGIFYLLISSKKIKECKNRLHTLGSGAHVVSAEYDGTRVVLSEENRIQLTSLLSYAEVWALTENMETSDEVHFTFDGDKIWKMDVYLIDDEYVKIIITGEEEYEILSDNNGRFEKYVCLASPEGWKSKNRIIGE